MFPECSLNVPGRLTPSDSHGNGLSGRLQENSVSAPMRVPSALQSLVWNGAEGGVSAAEDEMESPRMDMASMEGGPQGRFSNQSNGLYQSNGLNQSNGLYQSNGALRLPV
jgi:hypothetical protein